MTFPFLLRLSNLLFRGVFGESPRHDDFVGFGSVTIRKKESSLRVEIAAKGIVCVLVGRNMRSQK